MAHPIFASVRIAWFDCGQTRAACCFRNNTAARGGVTELGRRTRPTPARGPALNRNARAEAMIDTSLGGAALNCRHSRTGLSLFVDQIHGSKTMQTLFNKFYFPAHLSWQLRRLRRQPADLAVKLTAAVAREWGGCPGAPRQHRAAAAGWYFPVIWSLSTRGAAQFPAVLSAVLHWPAGFTAPHRRPAAAPGRTVVTPVTRLKLFLTQYFAITGAVAKP